MSATASATSANQTRSGAPWRSPAVVRGIGLVGVVKGFARGVLSLGLVMSGAVACLKREGGDPASANAGFDFKAVLTMLQRAVLFADALKARLRTPAVALALARFATGRAVARVERPWAPPPEVDATLAKIAAARTDERLRRKFRREIAGMSDAEVLSYIYSDLRRAAAMLGETDVAAEVEALANKAAALLAPNAGAPEGGAPGDAAPVAAGQGDVAPDNAPTRSAAHGKPDEGPDADRATGVQPTVREVGRGPPQNRAGCNLIAASRPLPLAGEGG